MHPAMSRLTALRPESMLAAFLSLLLFLAGAAVAYASITPEWSHASLASSDDPMGLRGMSFWGIATRNLGVLLALYAGVLTAGLLTAVTLTSLALYFGATFAVAVHNAQLGPVWQSVAWYLPWELGALLLGASIGFRPLIAALRTRRDSDDSDQPTPTRLSRYVAEAQLTLRPLGLAVLLLVVAAAAESLTIALR